MRPNTNEQRQSIREDDIVARLKTMSESDLCELARRLDSTSMTSSVLGWISAQRSVDLGTAMTLFINAEPHRWNYIPKEEVDEADRRLVAALDALCQRINCGYYLPDPERPLEKVREFHEWMRTQESDDRSRRKGRWRFNSVTVAPMISDIRFDGRRKSKPERGTPRAGGLFRKVFTPRFA